jgi:hypothetical protein
MAGLGMRTWKNWQMTTSKRCRVKRSGLFPTLTSATCLHDSGYSEHPGGSHPGNFNIDDPQTSLPDPHFTNGNIPASVAGSGISPSAGARGAGIQPQQPQSAIPMVPMPGSGNIPALLPEVAYHPQLFSIPVHSVSRIRKPVCLIHIFATFNRVAVKLLRPRHFLLRSLFLHEIPSHR